MLSEYTRAMTPFGNERNSSVGRNVRRSAQIAIGDCRDTEYLKAKRWDLGTIPGHRAFSNNSVVCNDIKDILDNEDFWKGYDGSGEPYGLINLKLSQSCGRLGDNQKDETVGGYNPCVSADTWILTDKGARQVSELIGVPTNVIVNGKSYPTTKDGFWLTGKHQVYLLTTEEGFSLRATANHQIMTDNGWLTLGSLQKGDKIALHKHLDVQPWEEEKDALENMFEKSSYEQHRAIFDKLATGALKATTETAEICQRMCARIGYILKRNAETGDLKLQYDYFCTVKEIIKQGVEDVYDCTVPDAGCFDANGMIVHNCAEISLSNHETCVSGDTRIHTYDGVAYIKDLVGKEVKIFNGEEWSLVKPFLAKEADTFLKITFSDGSVLKATPYHEFSVKLNKSNANFVKMRADELCIDLVLPTFELAPTKGESCSVSYDLGKALNDIDSILSYNKESILEFFAGWIDAVGIDRGDGYIIQDKEEKIRDAQIVLRRAGINRTRIMSWENKDWFLHIHHTECGKIPTRVKSFRIPKDGKSIRDYTTAQRIVSIERCEEEEPSYCFSEPKRHMGVFGNVLTYQCCLSELFLPNMKSKEELFLCAQYLYRICKHSLTLPCDSKETEAVVHKNMRIGIGVTGYLQATDEQRSWLSSCYEYIRALDKEYSAKNNFPPSIKLSTCKPSGCSRRDMLVSTTAGLLRLDEIGDVNGKEWQELKNISVLTDSDKDEKATKFYVNGKVPTKIITTEDGNELESSLNHKYRIVRDKEYVWETVENLKVGDRLVVKLGDHPENIITKLPFVELENRTNCQMIKQPTVLTKDIAWFLGLFYGDGSVHKNGIRISFNRKQPGLLQWLIKFFDETFGLRTSIDDDHSFSIASKQLMRWLEAHNCLKDHAHELSVPKIIRTASKENVIAFIDGFWRADGGIHSATNKWSVCTVSERFSRELFAMCRSVGYNMKLTCAGPGGLGSKDRWILMLRILDRTKMRYIKCEMRTRFYYEYWLDPIVDIQDSSCETYDIEVENAHHYRISGTISHNTLSIIGNCTSGVHPGFARYYKRLIRIASESPLISIAKKHGYPIEYVKHFDGSIDHTTQIVTFPKRLPDTTVLAEDCTAVSQLEWVKKLQTDWADNAVSVTVYYKKEELPEIKEWLKNNYNTSLKTVSFLLHTGHNFNQAPYQMITKEEYEELDKHCIPITDLEGICYNSSDSEVLANDKECVGGACPRK